MKIDLKSLCQKLAAISLALLLSPSISIAEEALFGHGPQPKTPPKFDDRNVKYVNQLLITLHSEHEPAFGKPLTRHFVGDLSKLAGLQLKYIRNDGAIHLFGLSKKYYETEVRVICKKILEDSRTKWCTPNVRFYLDSATAPNDPIYSNGQQWNLRDESPAGTDVIDAWKLSIGNASTVIAVVDNGIVPHVDIATVRLLPGYDFIADSVLAGDGNGRDANPTDPGDWGTTTGCDTPRSTWHGTAVTGIIGATTDNNYGIAGINQVAKLLPLRVGGKCQNSNLLDLIASIKWASGIAVPGVPNNLNPAKLLNLSLSVGNPCSAYPELQAAITELRKKSVTIIVAAGNDDGANVSQNSPASCNGVITVGSVTRLGSKGTSTIGSRIDIAAPGAAFTSAGLDKIPTTGDSGLTVPSGDSLITGYSGTSFATPHVTGIVSLMQGVRPALRPAQIKTIIKNTAKPFPIGTGSDCNTSTCGAGMLNGAAVVAAAKSKIASGASHTAAVKADGSVYTWGFNGNGQLGGGTIGARVNAPVKLAGLSDMSTVATGGFHSISAKRDGSVWAWGFNGNGRLGDGTTAQKNTPVQVLGLTNVIEVVAGDAHTLALKNDGTVWAWGYNFFGQLGAGSFDFNDRTAPVQIPSLTNVVAIAAGGKGSMALKSDGTVWVWGEYKSLIYGNTTQISSANWTATGGASGPYQIPNFNNIISIASGGSATTGNNVELALALNADGQLYAWGYNLWGQLGQGRTTAAAADALPALVPALFNKAVVNMATSGNHVVALTDDGQQFAWGLGGSGQLGDGKSGNAVGQTYSHFASTPILAATNLTNILDVAVGGSQTFALNSDLTYSSWGANSGGQLGDGSTTLKSAPITVLGSGSTGVYSAYEATSIKTDLQINISSTPNPAQAGQNITYTLGLVNLGTIAASNVRTTLVLPAEATFVSADSGCVYNANVAAVTCTVTSLGAATNLNAQVVAKINNAGSYAAVANTVFDGTDTSAINNVAGAQLLVSAANTSDNGDVPLPLWALAAMGAGLMGISARRREIRIL